MKAYRQRKQTVAEIQARCDRWNDAHPIGTEVEYHSVIGEQRHILTRTNSCAYVLGDHTAVLFVDGVAGCVALDAVIPASSRLIRTGPPRTARRRDY